LSISAGHQPTTRIARRRAAAIRFDWAFTNIRREDSYRLPAEVSMFFFAVKGKQQRVRDCLLLRGFSQFERFCSSEV